MMVSQALDTLTSMSATARLQQANKLDNALIINIDVNNDVHVSVRVPPPPAGRSEATVLSWHSIVLYMCTQ